MKWVKMVEENARQMLREDQAPEAPKNGKPRLRLAPSRDLTAGLEELQQIFKLARIPRRVEGFDISHIQGSHTVASMVVMLAGRPAPSEYRRFKIRSVEGVDDFKSMEEVVGRRYRRILDEKGELPDLVLIDGGPGQLSAALRALNALGLKDLACFGLAKRLEEFFLPGRADGIRLPERSSGRLLMQRLRDEAHRFAITYHRLLRAKAIRHSLLDEVPGIGPKTKSLLLKAFGSVEGVRKAPDEKLLEIRGIDRPKLARLRERLASGLSEKIAPVESPENGLE